METMFRPLAGSLADMNYTAGLRRSSDGYATDEAPTASLTENPGLRSISLNMDAPFSPFDEANGLQMVPTIHISRNGGWNGK